MGCRVVGIAGGAEKCRYVTEELGFDACLDHRGDLGAQLDEACPGGIDVYFENVGGAVQEAVFPRMRDFGRIAFCGMVAGYNVRPLPPGPNLTSVVRKRLRLQGFIVSDHPRAWATGASAARPGSARGSCAGRRMWRKGWRTRRTPSSGCSRGRISGSWW
ncbi:zinc-binding dehydrogenase [Teichococcus aestuarii]|uniref:zinc-binding dehydrogenase n=1 Tax=Teichococcus aestuarii TaxID=568898 RepID=UPI00360C4C0D